MGERLLLESNAALSTEELRQFQEQGYLGPYSLLEVDELSQILKSCYYSFPNLLLPSTLARHSVVKEMAELSMQHQFVSKVKALIGKNVLLWGSQVIKQNPFHRHRFHQDAEFAFIDGVAVWMAVKNVIPSECFYIITGSHLLNTSPQELSKKEGINLNDPKAVEAAAKKISPDCRLLHVPITDGQFILFHGKLWHGTNNPTAQPRFAFNFRYSTPSDQVRISANGELPNTTWRKQKPVCLLISGQDHFRINRLLEIDQINKLNSWIKGLFLYLPGNIFLGVVKRLKFKRH